MVSVTRAWIGEARVGIIRVVEGVLVSFVMGMVRMQGGWVVGGV
jgi:hypothetical protein